MSNPSGIIYACCSQGIARLRVCGRAQAHQCPSMRSFVEDVLSGRATEVRVDLSGCEHFDSTFLGTLLHLRRTKCATGGASLTIISPSEQSLELLTRMGAKRLFNIRTTETADETVEWIALTEEKPDGCGDDFKRNVVEAHQELADVDGPLQEQYRVIAQMAADDLADAQKR